MASARKSISLSKVIVIYVHRCMTLFAEPMVLTTRMNVYADAKVIVRNTHPVSAQWKRHAQDALVYWNLFALKAG